MQLMQPFNANDFDPTQGTGNLPVGRHPVIAVASEIKGTKANDGSGLAEFTLKIIDGPLQGVTGSWNFNLYNKSQKASEIAHKQFSAFCHVVNVMNPKDTSELHNIPFIVEVGPQKEDSQYTEIKKCFDRNGNEPRKAGQPAPAAQPMQQTVGNPPAYQPAPQAQPPAAWPGANPAQSFAPAANQAPANAPSWGNAQVTHPQPQGGAPGWANPAQGQAPQPQAQPASAPPWNLPR